VAGVPEQVAIWTSGTSIGLPLAQLAAGSPLPQLLINSSRHTTMQKINFRVVIMPSELALFWEKLSFFDKTS
jgi:hypothetical protein